MEDCLLLIFSKLGVKARLISKKYKTLIDNRHKFIELFRLSEKYDIIEMKTYWYYRPKYRDSCSGITCYLCYRCLYKDKYPVGIDPLFIDI